MHVSRAFDMFALQTRGRKNFSYREAIYRAEGYIEREAYIENLLTDLSRLESAR